MKYKMTYNDLDVLNQSIQQETQKPAFAFLLKEKVRNFYHRNSVRLNIMEEKFKELISKYVLHNEKDEPVTKKDENGVLVYEFNDEESRTQYMQDMKDFCSKSIEIEI